MDPLALLSLNLPPTQGCAFCSIETPLRLFIYTHEALRYHPTTSRHGSVSATTSITAFNLCCLFALQYP